MANSRQVVKDTILFNKPERLAYELPQQYGSDFFRIEMSPSIEAVPSNGKDEWGVIWKNIATCNYGEPEKVPLQSWDDWDKLQIPDINDPARWQILQDARERAGDKFLLGKGVPIFQRPSYLRGQLNLWMDIAAEPENLCKLIDVVTDMNLACIEKYADAGCDGFMFGDDWGLQDRLMINPIDWRKFWKPRYSKIFSKAHELGLLTFLHSCGYIIEILDDLIEAGLDVIQMDQQEYMGLELLHNRFAGKITFWSPADIQTVMARGDVIEIQKYCRKMTQYLSTSKGGFIAKCYVDHEGIGHSKEAVDAMCREFLNIASKGSIAK